MGLEIELQDDTGLRPQAAFGFSDAKGLAYALVELPIIATLEQHLGLDLAPLRKADVDWEHSLDWGSSQWEDLDQPDPARDAALQAQLRELQGELAALWQPPDVLRQAIVPLLGALDGLSASALVAIIQAVPARPSQRGFIEFYLGERGLVNDLRSVLLMLRWAELRGATRVRLVARQG